MNCKINGKLPTENLANIPSDLLNPFVHHLELSTTYEKIKTAVLTVALLPLRVLAIAVLLVVAWLLACVGLVGVTDEDLRAKPLVGWRRALVRVLCWFGKSSYQVGGMKIIIKGRQVSRAEAPILVIAPHSTFMDAIIVYVTGFPSIISRRESGLNPFIGKLINYTQPVYVWRDDPNSRQNTIKEIIDRATSEQDWPQVLIFPEGTCTNRSCLITFKPGAFYPGVPVQPVCIRYPNKLDTVTWTWEGPGALKLLWLTLTQLNSSCEIEFLPVYHPSEAEQKDPKLYASNVRNLMAKALGIPVSDYTYADCLLINKALELNIPSASDLIKVQKLRNKFGLTDVSVEKEVEAATQLTDKTLNISQFSKLLGVSSDDASLTQLFNIFDKNGTGSINVEDYLLDCLVIYKQPKTEEITQLAFKVVMNEDGDINCVGAVRAMRMALSVSNDSAHRIFQRIDKQNRGFITYEEFVHYIRRRPRFAGIFPAGSDTEEEQMSDDSNHEMHTPPAESPSHLKAE